MDEHQSGLLLQKGLFINIVMGLGWPPELQCDWTGIMAKVNLLYGKFVLHHETTGNSLRFVYFFFFNLMVQNNPSSCDMAIIPGRNVVIAIKDTKMSSA